MYVVKCRLRNDAELCDFWPALVDYINDKDERHYRLGDKFFFRYSHESRFTHDLLKYDVFEYLEIVTQGWEHDLVSV